MLVTRWYEALSERLKRWGNLSSGTRRDPSRVTIQ